MRAWNEVEVAQAKKRARVERSWWFLVYSILGDVLHSAWGIPSTVKVFAHYLWA